MRLFTSNLWNSATGSGLHCVWVCVQDGERLASLWIYTPASESPSQMKTREGERDATTCAAREELRPGDIAETRDFILWLHG
jgi:hypothetical protein